MGEEKGTAGQTQNDENNKTIKGNTAERGGKGGSNTKTQRTHRVSPSTKVSPFLGAFFVPLGLWGLAEFGFLFLTFLVFFLVPGSENTALGTGTQGTGPGRLCRTKMRRKRVSP